MVPSLLEDIYKPVPQDLCMLWRGCQNLAVVELYLFWVSRCIWKYSFKPGPNLKTLNLKNYLRLIKASDVSWEHNQICE